MWSQQEMKQRENLMKDLEKKFCERIQSKNVCMQKKSCFFFSTLFNLFLVLIF